MNRFSMLGMILESYSITSFVKQQSEEINLNLETSCQNCFYQTIGGTAANQFE